MESPQVHFVQTGEGRVAYQVVGDGERDLVFLPNMSRWNLDVIWEEPRIEAYLRRLGSFARLILPQPRGTALSDRVADGRLEAPEDFAHDVIAVMDEVGSARASVFCIEPACAAGVMLGASFPERISAIALLNGWGSWRRSPDYPIGMPGDVSDRFFGAMEQEWGTGAGLDFQSEEHAKDERFRNWWARLERLTFPSDFVGRFRRVSTEWDVTSILSAIKVPTLIMAHADHPFIRVDHGRYLAEHIPGATYREREGRCGVWWIDDAEWVLDEVESFFTGSIGRESFDDRVLATVMFTDIVGSTERAAVMGDQRWKALLEQHDAVARRQIERFRGRQVKSTGDGLLATFDGPARAIRCARALNDELAPLDLKIRTGLHTGEIEVRGNDVAGIAIAIAARVMAEAEAGQVLASGSIPPLVAGSGIEFSDLGERELKGVPGAWRLFAAS